MIDYFDRTFARRCRERHKVISQMGNSSVDLHCWRVDKTLLDPNVQCSLFVVQSAMTAFKSKSGFDKSQRFFFKSIGVETVDGPRLKIIRLWVICQEDINHPQNSDIYHPKSWTFPTPQKKHLPGGQLPPPFFFFFFWRTFLGFFDLQLMEDIKDGKEEVLDEVVMEHIK